jgi:nitrogen fixation/metabolism regulation signal transduction histidine kinase
MTTVAAKPLRAGAVMRYLLLICVGLGVAAVFLLASVSTNTALFSEYYPLLLGANLVIAVLLAAMVAYQLVSLRQKLKAGVFGAKLTLRLVTLFGLMAVLPGALIYGVSVQFVSQSIESWFEVRLDSALESGLNLGRGTLDGRLKELGAKAEAMALSLSSRPAAEHFTALNELRAARYWLFRVTSLAGLRLNRRVPQRCARFACNARTAPSNRFRIAAFSCGCLHQSMWCL